jgi:hypothetical protein
MLKLYQLKTSVNASFKVWLPKSQRWKRVEFNGGQLTPRVVRAIFQTSDPELQKAIEKAKFYNKHIKLVKEQELPEEKKERQLHTPDEYQEVLDVTNTETAKEFIAKHYGDEYDKSEYSTKAKVLEIAEEKKLKFPNW